MKYSYATEKPKLLTDEGQRLVIDTHDTVLGLLKRAGAVRMGAVMPSTEPWRALAVIDRLVEIGDLVEITQSVSPAQQDRIFVKAR